MIRLLLIPVLLFASAGIGRADKLILKAKAPAELKVVKSWGDIFDQPAVTLPDGSRIRLGIETSKIQRNGGFLVYALLDGTKWESTGSSPLGPLNVHVSRKSNDRALESLKRGESKEGRADYFDAKHLLFAASVAVGSEGEYELTVRGARESVLARATIRVMKESAACWLPFGPGREVKQQEAADREDVVRAHWGMQDTVPAQPRCEGRYPIRTRPDRGKEIPLTEGLPRWDWDGKPAGDMQLQIRGSKLVIESRTPRFNDGSYEQWLFRVWVNGRPFGTDQASSRCFDARTCLDRVQLARTLIADSDFNPALFKAFTGDRIAVQLMYAPDGWHEAGRESQRARLHRNHAALPVVTNKLEWVVR